MAVTGKGKQIAGKSVASSSSGKRKKVVCRGGGGGSRRKRRPGVLQFFDEAADDTDSESDDEDEEMEDQNVDGDYINHAKVEIKDTNGSGKPYALPLLLKEEGLSGDELEELINERYSHNSEYVVYGEDSKEYDEDSKVDGTIWRIKCMVGRERHIVFCLMQKFADLHNFGNRLHIFSAFCLEHIKGYIYVEADKESDVIESCKGFCNVYLSKVGLVPKHEIPHLFSVRSKACEVSKGTWVRMKNGSYKGDIAQVVAVDEERKKATIKLVPRIDLQAIAQKLGGGVSLKHAPVPSPRFLTFRELEDFRPLIETRRDRQTGEIYEILDGLMLKDGYLYKKVSIASVVSWGVEPSKSELQKFTEPCRDGPEDSEWVSSVYGSSKKMRSVEASGSKMTDKEGNAFGLHDLVFFGSKAFGVIVAMEKDSFQIVKGDMEEPVAVTVKAQEIKNICADKLFTAPDFKLKTISINDVVKVIEGPYQGRQGTVRHMYKGKLFIYDENQPENSGFFCVKSNLCENTKESHEVVKSRSMFTETSMSSSVQRDTSHSFNMGHQRERDQRFSIGQTLRIRKGPLKGYLCRVVGIYRSDITVKLDSLVKVITVQDNVLSEPNLRRDASEALPSDLSGTHEWMPSGGLTEDGKETSVAKISWDAGMSSGRDPWQGFSSNIISSHDDHATDKGHVPDPWGKRVASGQDQEHVAVPWGSKAASEHDQERGDDPWGSKLAAVEDKGNGTNAWGSKVAFEKDQENRAGAWGSKTAPRKDQEKGDDPWGSKPTIGRDKESGAEPWGSKMVPGKDKESRAEPWGSKTSPGKDKESGADSWGSRTPPRKELGADPWGSKATSGRDLEQAELWGNKTASRKGIDNKFDPWGSNVTSNRDQKQDVNLWADKDNSNVIQRSTWDGETVAGKDKEDVLDIKGKSIRNEVDTWSKPTGSQENNNPERSDWVKPYDQITSIGGAQASGWGSAAVRLSQSAAENEGQSSTWDKVKVTSVETDSWARTKISTDAGTGNWNKAGSSNPNELGGWNKQKTSDGDPVSSWNNKNNHKTEVNYQRDSWEKPSNFEGGCGLGRGGGRGRGWQRGGNDSYVAGGARDQESSPNQETEFDGGQQSGWGVGRGRGSGPSGRFGARGRGRDAGSRGFGFNDSGGNWGRGRGRAEGQNGDDDYADARPFGRGRGRGHGRFESSDWKNNQDTYVDGCLSKNTASAWGNDQSGGQEKPQGFGKNDVSVGNGEQQGDWSKPMSFGGERGRNFSFNRGRGRGRNFSNEHTSRWNGADTDGDGVQSETFRGQKTFGQGQSSSWSQGESTGRARRGGGGPQGNRNGGRGGRGGRWGEECREDSGGRWGEGCRGGRWNGGGRDGSRGRWNERGRGSGGRSNEGGRGGSSGRWNEGKEPSENGPSDKGSWGGNGPSDKSSWGSGNADKGSWGGWKSNTGVNGGGRTGQNSDWNKGPADGERISSAGDWNRPNESKTVDCWSQKNITGRTDGSGGWKASGTPPKETSGGGQLQGAWSRGPSYKGEQASSWNQKGANASGWTEQNCDRSKSPIDGVSGNKANAWNRPIESKKADGWSQKNISGCDEGSDGWKVSGAPAKETGGASQQEDSWSRGPHKEHPVLAKELKDSSPQKEEVWGQGASQKEAVSSDWGQDTAGKGKNSSGWDSRSELAKEINVCSTQKEESQGQEASSLTWGHGASTKEALTSYRGQNVSAAEASAKEDSALGCGGRASTEDALASDWGPKVSALEGSASDWGQRGATKEASRSDWGQVSSTQEAPASDCSQGTEASLSGWVRGVATKEPSGGGGETGLEKSGDPWGKANEGSKGGW